MNLKRTGSRWDRNQRININDNWDVIEQWLNQLAESAQDLVAEGQLTPAQYAELIKEVNGLIARGEVKLDDLSPEILEAINNGDGTPFEILSIPRDRSVSPEKTTFIDTSSNLVDAVNVKRDKELNNNGEVIDSNGLGVSESIVSIEPGSEHVFKGVYSVGLYDQSMNFNRRLFIYSENEMRSAVFSELEYYMQPTIYLRQADTAQGNVGSSLHSYEPFYRKLNHVIDASESVKEVDIGKLSEPLKSRHIGDKEITTRKTDFIEHSSNLFDESSVLEGSRLTVDGAIEDSVSSVASDFIRIDANQSFVIKQGRENSMRLSFYNSQKEHLEQQYRDDAKTEHGFISPIGTHYIRFSINRLSNEGVQLNLGDQALPYEPYHKPRLSEDIEVTGVDYGGIGNHSDIKNLDSLIVDKYSLSYIDIDMLPRKEPTTAAAVVYSKFDDLVAQYPDMLKKTKLRDSVEGQEIAVYDYNMNDVVTKKDNMPNVVIVASLHGTERIPPYTVYDFLRILCENTVINNSIDVLRSDLQFRVIPIANPDGWDNDTRKNANGIDIARQFPADFIGDSVPPDASTYGGTEPLTEPEALNIKDIINEHTISVIDFHNFSRHNNLNYFYWVVGGSDLDISMGRSFIAQVSKKLKDKWDFLPQSKGDHLGYSSEVPGGSPGRYATSLGINGATFESCMSLINDPDDTSYSKYVMTASLEGFINWLILSIKFSNKLK